MALSFWVQRADAQGFADYLRGYRHSQLHSIHPALVKGLSYVPGLVIQCNGMDLRFEDGVERIKVMNPEDGVQIEVVRYDNLEDSYTHVTVIDLETQKTLFSEIPVNWPT